MNVHPSRLFAPFAALLLTLLIVSPLLPAHARTGKADAIVGLWLTEGGKSKVLLSRAGSGFTGKIIWLKEPNYVPADRDGYLKDKTDAEYRALLGKPKRDGFNPDPAKRTRPVFGLSVLSGFKYSGDNVWEDGEIYCQGRSETFQIGA